DSRGALIEAINDYPGAVILVSHDRFLLEACADRLWLVSDGRVTSFDGDLDDYRRLVLSADAEKEQTREPRAQRESRADTRRAAAEKRAEAAPLRRRVSEAEAAMQHLSAEIASIDAALADGGLFTRDPSKAATLAKRRSDCVEALGRAEDAWLDASAASAAASASFFCVWGASPSRVWPFFFCPCPLWRGVGVVGRYRFP